MKYYKIFIINLLIFSICACGHKVQAPNIDNIKDELKLMRFEKDIFNTDFDRITDSLNFFRKNYGEFFDLFNYKIIRIGNCNSASYPDLIKGFLTDYNINMVKRTVDSSFSNFMETENRVRELFRFYKYYFPEKRVPLVVTFISGFNQSIITTDTILGIGLDKYLGSNCAYYLKLGYPNYMRYNLEPYRIPYDCAMAWAITQFPLSESASNLLSNMIYKGKIAYFIKMLIPESPDSLLLAMSEEQIKWCKKNEKQMWSYLVENKILFKTDFLTIKKFVEEAPFTKDFGQNSPGRAIIWCGYQIVSKYMDNQKGLKLNDLMAEEDYQKILRISKYKP